MKAHILSEIRRVAASSGERPPGRGVFERETGIKQSAWLGVYWARWSDACVEAGFSPNRKTTRINQVFIFEKLAQAFRHYGKIPTVAEFRMYRQIDADFPWHTTLQDHFGTKDEMLVRLRQWATANQTYLDVAAMIPDEGPQDSSDQATVSESKAFVYLIKSGAHYKIGNTNDLERRIKELRVQMPEATEIVHSIRTDDPTGIEKYWHDRFADRHVRGEWFKLTKADIAAFRRRKSQ